MASYPQQFNHVKLTSQHKLINYLFQSVNETLLCRSNFCNRPTKATHDFHVIRFHKSILVFIGLLRVLTQSELSANDYNSSTPRNTFKEKYH